MVLNMTSWVPQHWACTIPFTATLLCVICRRRKSGQEKVHMYLEIETNSAIEEAGYIRYRKSWLCSSGVGFGKWTVKLAIATLAIQRLLTLSGPIQGLNIQTWRRDEAAGAYQYTWSHSNLSQPLSAAQCYHYGKSHRASGTGVRRSESRNWVIYRRYSSEIDNGIPTLLQQDLPAWEEGTKSLPINRHMWRLAWRSGLRCVIR